jgi:hypothetical protein
MVSILKSYIAWIIVTLYGKIFRSSCDCLRNKMFKLHMHWKQCSKLKTQMRVVILTDG